MKEKTENQKMMASVDKTMMHNALSPQTEGGSTASWTQGTAQEIMEKCIQHQIEAIRNHPGYSSDHHHDRLTTTNIWHMRQVFADEVEKMLGKVAAQRALEEIQRHITCYAAKLHLNRGYSIMNPSRGINRGYAPTFEEVTSFPGRVEQMAQSRDLIGTSDPNSPWKKGMPRMVFVSDMGDALTQHSADHLDRLNRDVLDPIRSEKGRRHIWQWLTKRPGNMAKLARRVGGLPENVCAMTTLTSGDARNLRRLDQLKQVDAASRGLSVEPLWERIPPADLNLRGIDWLILGGESGDKNARPFDLAWAREIRDICREQGVAFFLKQLGRNPVENGELLQLSDSHGGDWSEWPEDLRVREFPQAFWTYREIPKVLKSIRPSSKPVLKEAI